MIRNSGAELFDQLLTILGGRLLQRPRDQVSQLIVDDARNERFKKYLGKVAARSASARGNGSRLDAFDLTDRERQVLRLLSEDESLHSIAHRLDLSHATVRNHVQHVLNKLGVHSILEAIAFYFLIED